MERRSFVFAAFLTAFLFPSIGLAQDSDSSHPIVGVWRLNLEQSSYEPGPGPRSILRRFIEADDGFLISIRITEGGQGNPNFAMVRMKFDGQDYEVWTTPGLGAFLQSGDRPGVTAAFTETDDRTLSLLQKTDGTAGALSPNTWEVAADGSTLTVTTSGTTPDGVSVSNVEVYDRVG